MTTPVQLGTPPAPPFAGPPTDNSQVAAWTLYQQQLKEYNDPRPIEVTGGQLPAGTVPPTQSIHPDWVNPCAECGAQIQTPCVGPHGIPLGYLHAPRLMLKPPPATAQGFSVPNTFNKNGL